MKSLYSLYIIFGLIFFTLACGTTSSHEDKAGPDKRNEALVIAPDLTIKSIDVNDQGFLLYTIVNEGRADIPNPEEGEVDIYVNERFIARQNVQEDLTEVITAGGQATFVTDFKLESGENRIAVLADIENRIDEFDELQNSRNLSIENPISTITNLSVKDLDRDAASGFLSVVLENPWVGRLAASPATFRIVKNGEESIVERNLEALPPRTSRTINFAIPVSASDKVEVSVRLGGIAEVNLLDNMRREFPMRFSEEIDPRRPQAHIGITKYAEFIERTDILPFVNWISPEGPRNFSTWTFREKNDLFRIIRALEIGQLEVMHDIPDLVVSHAKDAFFSEEEAWNIYLRNLAVSLWVEVKNRVPWSIADYDEPLRANLLDAAETYEIEFTDKYRFKQGNWRKVHAWNPQIYHHFLASNRLIAPTTLSTLYRLTEWMIGHYTHVSIAEGQSYADLYGLESQAAPLKKVIFPLPGQRYFSPSGCYGVSASYRALLRSVNIPAIEARTDFQHPGSSIDSHSRPIFLSDNLTFPHGDDIYNGLIKQSGNKHPVEDLFLSLEAYDQLIVNPEVDCVDGDCNTTTEQALYNSLKRYYEIALNNMTDGILDYYRPSTNRFLDNILTTSGGGGMTLDYVRPYYDEEERATHIANITQTIRDMGHGDPVAGLALVNERLARWNENKGPSR